MTKLREIGGLNKYEELVYLALVRKGLSTSYTISGESGVPYGRIYPVLASLQAKGFVKVFNGKPKKFLAVEPKVMFSSLIGKKSRELEKNKAELGNLLQELEKTRKSRPSEPKEAVQVIEGKKNYLNLSVKLHEKAKREWRAIHGFPVYKPHLDAYRKMAEKGIRTMIIAPLDKKDTDRHEIWKSLGIKIKFSSRIISRYTVIDDTDVILRIRDLIPGRYTAVWIQSPALAKTLISNFDRLWDLS